MEDDKPHAALLHGVTGSGKTVVFLKLIERTLELGRRALVLVPEISLTPQMIRRLKSTFGSRLAVQHSALNNTERLLQWRMIQQGNADIVVGTRSAVFSPLHNLGLIIVDEEQEHTYQSESAPRYDAHDIAKKRAVMENALLVLCLGHTVDRDLPRRPERQTETCYPHPALRRLSAAQRGFHRYARRADGRQPPGGQRAAWHASCRRTSIMANRASCS